MLREMTQAVEIDGEKYQVRKMDVISATYLLKFLTQKLLPVFTEAQKLFLPEEAPASAKKSRKKQDDNGADVFVALLPKLLDAISEEDLHHIIVKCLNYCDKSLPAGWQKVMTGESYGIKDIEYDLTTCLLLCYHCIVFNCGGFFGEGGSLFSLLGQSMKSPIL